MSTPETEPLLSTTSATKGESTKPFSKWTKVHTIWSILIRIVGDIITKNIVVFYEDYRSALNLTMVQYSSIIISQQIGVLIALLLLPLITHFIPSLTHKISLFGFLSGILCMLFILPAIISTNTSFILIWSCIDRILYSICFNIYITSILDLATKYNSDKQGKTIALLNFSSTIASLFYVVIGFIIQYIDWWLPSMLFGSILCGMSILSCCVYNFPVNDAQTNSVATKSWLNSMKSVICSSKSILIFICSLIMGCFTSSVGMIMLSMLFEDIYGLNSLEVGMAGLVIFFAELIGTSMLQGIIDKYGEFKCALLSFTSKFIACFTLFLVFIFAVEVDESAMLSVCIVIVFVLYFGGQMCYITHQVLIVKHTLENDMGNDMSMMLMMNFVCMTVGGVIGVYLSTFLWDQGFGMWMIAGNWMGLTMISVSIYGLLYCMKNKIWCL